MKYQFIIEKSIDFPLTRIYHVMDVSKSGYYAWLKAPKIHEDLIESGVSCSIHRVESLINLNNIDAKIKKKFKTTTDSKHSYPVAPNLLNEDFIVEKKDTVWVSDITYIEI